jgi:hypothetical protein
MSRTVTSVKKVTTVWLEAEEKNSRNRLKMFHCVNCRSPVVQYRGDAIAIVPGNHPYEPMVIVKCKGTFKNEAEQWEECGYYYSFVSTVHTKVV